MNLSIPPRPQGIQLSPVRFGACAEPESTIAPQVLALLEKLPVNKVFEARTSTGKRAFGVEQFTNGNTWVYFPINYRPSDLYKTHEFTKDGQVKLTVLPSSLLVTEDATKVVNSYFKGEASWETQLPATLFKSTDISSNSRNVFEDFETSNQSGTDVVITPQRSSAYTGPVLKPGGDEYPAINPSPKPNAPAIKPFAPGQMGAIGQLLNRPRPGSK